MSKLIEHAAYLEQDPNDPDSVFFVARIGVKKVLVEAGFIEKIARYRKWDETGSPCEHLRLGIVQDASQDVVLAVKKEAEEAAQATVAAEIASVVALIQQGGQP